MRRILSVLLVAAMLLLGVWAFRPELLPWENITTGVDSYAAAQYICAEIDANPAQTTFRFRDERIDREALYRTMEALWPYAFTLSVAAHQNGMLTIGVERENEAAQRQAALLAQGVVQQLITEEMPLRERLLVLHDYVTRNCMYDVETAERETLREGSGADAPFTAAGALVDGTAVCAGYSRAFMLLCDAAGIDALYISDQEMNHGWNAVRYYDEIVFVDTTFDDPVPDRGAHTMTDFFLKTKDEFSETHTWNKVFYGKIIEKALPESLGTAQKIYDLGLLPTPPRAEQIDQPLDEETRVYIQARAHATFAEKETLGSAAEKLWHTVSANGGAREFIDRGIFGEVRARQVGLPESSIKK